MEVDWKIHKNTQ